MDIDPTLPDREIGEESEPQLFDIAQAPNESVDLAAEHPERVKEMRSCWDQWFEEVYREWKTRK